ncbi:MAG: hypothetical protein LBV18_00575 [Alistipes sp.]|jgi:hypothetical protein|nr:hypothetical protein [Alistipes sp.]
MIKRNFIVISLVLSTVSYVQASAEDDRTPTTCEVAATQASVDTTRSVRKVPIVVYSPFDFYGQLMDAFKCTETQDYYLVTRDSICIYNNRDARLGRYMERDLRKLSGLGNLRTFRERILTTDSCFLFSPIQFTKYDNRYLGIKEGHDLHFIDGEGNRFDSLEELLLDFTNAEFLDTYFDAYIDEVKDKIYNWNYSIENEDEAVSILKNDYNFRFFYDRDEQRAIDMFLGHISSFIDIDNNVLAAIKADLESFFADKIIPDTADRDEFNTVFGQFVREADMEYVPLMLNDVSEILRNNLSEDEFQLFVKRHRINRNKTRAAFLFLRRTYRSYVYGDVAMSSVIPYGKFVEYFNQMIFMQ